MNLFTKQKQTHRLRQKFMVTRDKGWAEGIVREFGINMYTLLYLKWITNISQSVQSLSHVQLFATPRTAARQVSISIANPSSLLLFGKLAYACEQVTEPRATSVFLSVK